MKKKNVHVSIETPCHEKYKDFKPTKEGGYCSSCEKEVIDFSQMTNTQIIEKLKGTSNACGRFRESQLGHLGTTYDKSSNFTFSYLAAGLSLVSMLGFNDLVSQNTPVDTIVHTEEKFERHLLGDVAMSYSRTIKLMGQVVDEQGTAIPFANVYVDTLHAGAATKIDGTFELELDVKELSELSLSVTYIGYRSVIVKNISTEGVKGIVDIDPIILKNDAIEIGIVDVKELNTAVLGNIGFTMGKVKKEKKWAPRWVWRKTTMPFRRLYYKLFK